MTGGTGYALGDESRALFMTGKNVRDMAVVKRVVKRQNRAAGDAGQVRDALAFE